MCSPPGLAAPHRHNFFSLDFIKSKWKCLHRPVTSLISKHRLIVGWSRVWGCQLYPRCGPQGQTVSGTGRARGELRSPSVPTHCPRARALHSRPHWAAQPQPRTRCLFVASTQAPEQLHKGALPHIGHSIAHYSHPCVTASLTAPLVHLRGHALIHALGKTVTSPSSPRQPRAVPIDRQFFKSSPETFWKQISSDRTSLAAFLPLHTRSSQPLMKPRGLCRKPCSSPEPPAAQPPLSIALWEIDYHTKQHFLCLQVGHAGPLAWLAVSAPR